MGTDKNTVIGIILIVAIVVGYYFYNMPSQAEQAKMRRAIDSVRMAEEKKKQVEKEIEKQVAQQNAAITDSLQQLPDSVKKMQKAALYGVFADAMKGEDGIIVLENELIKAQVAKKGGRIIDVELKKYKSSNPADKKKPLHLFTKEGTHFGLSFWANTRNLDTDSLYFTSTGKDVSVNGTQTGQLAMRLNVGSPDKYIEFVYTIKGNDYIIDYKVNLVGLQGLIQEGDLAFNWDMKTPSQEKDLKVQRTKSTVYYKYLTEDPANLSETEEEDKKKLELSSKWVAFKQQFFTSVLIAQDKFNPASTVVVNNGNNDSYVKQMNSTMYFSSERQPKESYAFKFYFGPSHYNTLKEYDISLERQIPLGWGIFGWVNRFIVIPVFNFLNSFSLSYGLVILILTLVIKTILFPIAYKNYLSSAKMQVLKPEIEELNAKYANEDPLKKQQATMALYKKAGVNPMAGCIPALLQMPILMALINFFPSSIELRQQSFLWADDLSTYDSILTLPFTVPLGYGSHVSLFALLMTASTILYTYTNSQLMGTTNNQMPAMKWMMYLMPVMFLFFLNSSSAALSYYYFLANIITFGQTHLMKRFIDHDALHRKIQENKQKPPKVSNFQKRLEQMMKERQQQTSSRKK
jgi:YidC/Oxa1 family membrane protein insertase